MVYEIEGNMVVLSKAGQYEYIQNDKCVFINYRLLCLGTKWEWEQENVLPHEIEPIEALTKRQLYFKLLFILFSK